MLKKLKNGFKWDGNFVKTIELIMEILIVIFCFQVAVIIKNQNLELLSAMKEIFVWIKGDLKIFDIVIGDGRVIDKVRLFQNIIGNTIFYVILIVIMFRTYETSLLKKNFKNSISSVFLALLFTNLFIVLINFIFPYFIDIIDFKTFAIAFLLQLYMFIIFKAILWKILKNKVKKFAIVIGDKTTVDHLIRNVFLDKSKRNCIKIIHYIEDNKINDDVFELIKKVDIVYLTSSLNKVNKNKIMTHTISFLNKKVFLVPELYELSMYNAKTKNIDDKIVYEVDSLYLTLEQRFLKRTFDIIVSIIGLILSIPVYIILFILIKIEDRGPMFYTQERITKNNKTFKIYKIRSMITNAEKNGAQLAVKNDARVTKVGKIIRKLRIDELPQFLNVLKGDMSIVGPRPERKQLIDEIKKTESEFVKRVNVKAGLTGYAHAYGKYSTNFKDRLRMDLFYIKNQSFFFDIKILFATILAVFNKDASAGTTDSEDLEKFLDKFDVSIENVSNEVKILRNKKGDNFNGI